MSNANISNDKENTSQKPRSGNANKGFASMDPQKQREIASKGGKAAHLKGTAHEFTSEKAREAGRKGGRIAHQKGTAHQFNSEKARIAGKKGGSRKQSNEMSSSQ